MNEPGVRLELTFENDTNERITDSSGKGNHGVPKGSLKTVKDQNGKSAKYFDGNSAIDLKKTQSLMGFASATDHHCRHDQALGRQTPNEVETKYRDAKELTAVLR